MRLYRIIFLRTRSKNSITIGLMQSLSVRRLIPKLKFGGIVITRFYWILIRIEA